MRRKILLFLIILLFIFLLNWCFKKTENNVKKDKNENTTIITKEENSIWKNTEKMKNQNKEEKSKKIEKQDGKTWNKKKMVIKEKIENNK